MCTRLDVNAGAVASNANVVPFFEPEGVERTIMAVRRRVQELERLQTSIMADPARAQELERLQRSMRSLKCRAADLRTLRRIGPEAQRRWMAERDRVQAKLVEYQARVERMMAEQDRLHPLTAEFDID